MVFDSAVTFVKLLINKVLQLLISYQKLVNCEGISSISCRCYGYYNFNNGHYKYKHQKKIIAKCSTIISFLCFYL